jgi:hypothetical protein
MSCWPNCTDKSFQKKNCSVAVHSRHSQRITVLIRLLDFYYTVELGYNVIKGT